MRPWLNVSSSGAWQLMWLWLHFSEQLGLATNVAMAALSEQRGMATNVAMAALSERGGVATDVGGRG